MTVSGEMKLDGDEGVNVASAIGCILPAAVFATTQVALVLTSKYSVGRVFGNMHLIVSTETQFARHSWDIRLSWFDGSYFKVSTPIRCETS